jgi:hypothetical protein
MASPFNKPDHMICRMDRKGMLGKTRPWRDVGGHFTHMVELPIRGWANFLNIYQPLADAWVIYENSGKIAKQIDSGSRTHE